MGSNVVLAKDGPINIRPEFFALHCSARQPLNVWTALGRNLSLVLPGPNSSLRDTKLASQKSSIANQSSSSLNGVVCTFHSRSIDSLYFKSKENLSPAKNRPNYPVRMENQESLRQAVSDYVRAARKHAKLTQTQLGTILGCGKQNVSSWENGRHSPSPIQLANIAHCTKLAVPPLLAPSEAPTSEALPGAGSAREIALALRISVKAITEKWGISIEDLTDGSPAALARMEAAIAIRMPSSSNLEAENDDPSPGRGKSSSIHDYDPPGAGYTNREEPADQPTSLDGSAED